MQWRETRKEEMLPMSAENGVDRELFERVNPVSKTAVPTLAMLAKAGYADAQTILGRLGVRLEDYAQGRDMDELGRYCHLIVREFRYVTLNRLVAESGIRCVFDLPCGYTPRALVVADAGRRYVGGDLPVVVESLRPVLEGMLTPGQRDMVSLAVVDATNYDSMLAAVADVEGPICVATEGLMMYLTNDERRLFLQNMRRLLAAKGGCWINADAETMVYYRAVYLAVAGPKKAVELIQKTKGAFSRQSDTNIDAHAMLRKTGTFGLRDGFDYDALEREYASMGLAVERVPVTLDGVDLHVLASMGEGQANKLKELVSQVRFWKMTADPSFAEGTQDERTYEDAEFKARVGRIGTKTHIVLSGRVDSITAPTLLRAWEESGAGQGVEAIEIECADLSYLSSAGLRVLMMRKALPTAPIVLTNVRPSVVEVLDMSGLIDYLEVR